MDAEAVEVLATSVAAKVAATMAAHETLANQMMVFHQEDREFKTRIESELKAIRRDRTMLPAIALALAGLSLALSLYVVQAQSAFQARTSQEVEMLASVVKAAHARQP